MTAEVAVVNKSAIALAADSAATISDQDGNGQKTYLANKLFALSNTQPLGIMVYGTAELLGVPWETAIRDYRSHLGTTSFDTVQEYAGDFFRHLADSDLLFTRPLQDLFVRMTISALIHSIREEAAEKVQEAAMSKQKLTSLEISSLHAKQISEFRAFISKQQDLPDLPANFGAKVVSEHAAHIRDEKDRIFRQHSIPLSSAASKSLTECIREVFNKGHFPWGTSGVVLAGFGEREIFPHLVACDVASVVRGRVLVRPMPHKSFPMPGSVSGPLGTSAGVIAFAQTDVMETLIEGCGRVFRDEIYSRIWTDRLETLKFVRDLVNGFGALKPSQIARIEKSARLHILDQHRKLKEDLRDHSQAEIDKLLETIEFLPKEELARLATALVELTSVKRRMSLEIETVGGPVDTAVISKGEGFVWINKKQYFDPQISR